MELFYGILAGVVVLAAAGFVLYEYRLRRPDVLALYEKGGRLAVRGGPIYPRHFTLALRRQACPLQLTVQAAAAGNLGVNVRLAGSFAAAPEGLAALVRVGGWDPEAAARAAEAAGIMLEGLVKEHVERLEIHELSSAGVVAYVEARAGQFVEKFGLELVSLAVQSLEPAEAEIAEALRQQEQARLLEQTERLNHQARAAAARARFQADEEIAALDHALELKKNELRQALQEQESALAQQQVEDELRRSRLRLEFEREELAILKDNPELLILTPQAARLAEASQGLKNARTVISLSPQEPAGGNELLALFQGLLQKALEARKPD